MRQKPIRAPGGVLSPFGYGAASIAAAQRSRYVRDAAGLCLRRMVRPRGAGRDEMGQSARCAHGADEPAQRRRDA